MNFIRNLLGFERTSGVQEPKPKGTEEPSPPPREPGELIREIAASIKPQGDSRIRREASWNGQFYDLAKQYPQDLELSIVKDFSTQPQQTRDDAEGLFAAQTKLRGISCDKDRYLSMVDAYLEEFAKFQASETVNTSPTMVKSLFEAQQNISGTAGGISAEGLSRTADGTKTPPPQVQGTGKTEAGSSETIKPRDAEEVIKAIAAKIKQDIPEGSYTQRERTWTQSFRDNLGQNPHDSELTLLKNFLALPNQTIENAEKMFEAQAKDMNIPHDEERFFSMVNFYFQAREDFQSRDTVTVPKSPIPEHLQLPGVTPEDINKLRKEEFNTGTGSPEYQRARLEDIISKREALLQPWKNGLATPPSDEPPADSYAQLAGSLRESSIEQILQAYSGDKGYGEWNRDLEQLALLGKDSLLDSMDQDALLKDLSQGKDLTFRGNKFWTESKKGFFVSFAAPKNEFFIDLALELNNLIEQGPKAREILKDISNKFHDMPDNPLALSLKETIHNLDTYIQLKDGIKAIVNKNPKIIDIQAEKIPDIRSE
jgi:hypothetical protein